MVPVKVAIAFRRSGLIVRVSYGSRPCGTTQPPLRHDEAAPWQSVKSDPTFYR